MPEPSERSHGHADAHVLPADELLRRVQSGVAAREICQELTALTDARIVQAAVADLGVEGMARFQFLAVGGYGRRETFPHADIDLVVLYDDPFAHEDAEPFARIERAAPGFAEPMRRFLLDIRDTGLRLSARVRSRHEHERLIQSDVTAATAALDCRHVAGTPLVVANPAGRAAELIRQGFAGGARGFCALVREGLRARHEQFGGSAFLLEPQLKMGRGGLRDGHAIRWAARLLFDTVDLGALASAGHVVAEDAQAFEQAYAFVARARLVLHAMSRWRNDRLAFEKQAEVARAMGFGQGTDNEAVSAMMRAHYRHAGALSELAERWIEEWSIELAGEGWREQAGDVGRVGDFVAARPDAPPRDLRGVGDLLRAARALALPLFPTTRSAIRVVGAALDSRTANTPEAVSILRAALLEPEPDAASLRTLVDLDLFRRLVPEWSHIVGHTSHDVYHVFTTDRHLLESFALVAALGSEQSQAPPFVAAAWDRVVRAGDEAPDALRVAALCHDIGKAMDGDHCMIGAGMVVEICRRLELGLQARELARWLVLEHLRMARVSQRRDLSDPETIAAFVAHCADARSLDALTVLTWADATSVSPRASHGWKVELLRSLHEPAWAQLSGTSRVLVPLANRAPVTERLEAGLLRADDVVWLASELDAVHWATFGDDEIGAAVALLLGARDSGGGRVELETSPATGRALLWVCTRDRVRLLHDLTAAIASDRVSILRARIFTTRSGWVVDRFDLDWTDPGGRSLQERRRDRLLELVTGVTTGAIDPGRLRQRWATESRLNPRSRPAVATQIKLIQEASRPDLHVVEVKTRDRVGLLADLARALSELGFEIDRSIISSEGDRAIDTFYVRQRTDGTTAPQDLPRLLTHVLGGGDGAEPAAR